MNIQSLTGLSGYCETRTAYCVASCSLRRAKGGSPASAYNDSIGEVLKAPRAIRNPVCATTSILLR